MSDYRRRFPNQNSLCIVIHAEGAAQAALNADIAFGEGADGILLICHSASSELLRICYEAVRHQYPDQWIGLNWLTEPAVRAFDYHEPDMDGLWIDNAEIYDDEVMTAHRAGRLVLARQRWEEEYGKRFLLFGGVAFKYQHAVEDYQRVAQLAVPYVDVITTSGERTGSPPSLEKIRELRRGAGTHPLAVASGISPENVEPYLPYVDCFLVATGVSNPESMLNAQRVKQLARLMQC